MQRMNLIVLTALASFSFQALSMDTPEEVPTSDSSQGWNLLGGLSSAYNNYAAPVLSTVSATMATQFEEKKRWYNTRNNPELQASMIGTSTTSNPEELEKTKGHYETVTGDFASCDAEKDLQPFLKRLDLAIRAAHALFGEPEATETITKITTFLNINELVLPDYVTEPLKQKRTSIIINLKTKIATLENSSSEENK